MYFVPSSHACVCTTGPMYVEAPFLVQVVTKVEHGEGPFCKSNFTVSFFVPFGDQVWRHASNTSISMQGSIA